jgi:pimeloyl-ACP methyl ester carboxylesterase
MEPVRLHGSAPYSVAVLHGGPGGCGEAEPVAREIGRARGVIEPMGQALSVEGQIQEICGILQDRADLPVSLVGFSWGAWLAWIFAARFPSKVRSLILVSSGPFRESYAAGISETRLGRLSPREREEAGILTRAMERPGSGKADKAFARFGALISKADAFDPLFKSEADISFRIDVFQRVWPEAAALRRSGELLAMGKEIACPVTAIHGDYDPHPAEGVRVPLSETLRDLRFILLERCGHRPWIERHAREEFFRALDAALP